MYTASHEDLKPRLFDLGPMAGPKTVKINKMLKDGWAEVFRNEVYPLIPSDEFGKKYFCLNNGRASKDVTNTLGLMVIQEILNLTDKGVVRAFSFNIEVHHALYIDDISDATCYITRKTFWDFKEKVRAAGDEETFFNIISMGLAKLHNLDASCMRLDSVNIRSNMKKLSRCSLFRTTVNAFLKNLKKDHLDLFNTIDESISSKYTSKKTGYSYFGGVKPEQRGVLLSQMASDIHILVRMFQDNDTVKAMQSFISLKRMFGEQCKVTTSSDGEEKAELKPPKEVPANSLQNPSDPSAGHDAHKSEGTHQIQAGETCNPKDPNGKPGEESENELRLVLYVKPESAADDDSHALKPAVDDLQDKDVEVKDMLADTSYGGDENVEYAKSKGVRLVSPVPGTKGDKQADSVAQKADGDNQKASDSDGGALAASELDGCEIAASPVQEADAAEVKSEPVAGDESSKRLSLADFERDEDGKIISCPKGQKASTCENKAGTGFFSSFDAETCQACPFKDACPVRVGKRKASINYTVKDIRIAERRRANDTPEFKQLYRLRSGIEATNSEFARRYGGKRLRVRGAKAVRCAVFMKFLALNIGRVTAYERKKAK